MTTLKDPRIRTTIPPLTPRQREVLELLAKGYSNPQIGQALGISLDGAKWHVGEIMGRLGVDSREEAAAFWRDYNRPAARLVRLARALVPVAGWAKWGAAVAGIGAVSAIAVITVVALGTGDSGGHPAGVPSAITNVAATATAVPSSTAGATTIAGAASTATNSSVSPTSRATPPPTPALARTGILAVDKAIAAMEAQDYVALANQLITRRIQCGVTPAADDWAFDCPPGTAAGTTFTVYTTAGCDHPSYFPMDTAPSTLARFVSGPPKLYGVARNSDGTFRVVFDDASDSAFTLTVNGSGITTVGRACGAAPADVLASIDASAVIYRSPEASSTPVRDASGVTGVSTVDKAIGALEAGNYDILAGMIATHDERCGLNPPPPDSWPSPCAPGIATGTVQAVYTVGGCDGPTWMPASTAGTTIASLLSGAPHLYGVAQNPDSTYSAVFQDGNESAFTLGITSEGVVSVSRACGAPASAVLAAANTIIAGPFD